MKLQNSPTHEGLLSLAEAKLNDAERVLGCFTGGLGITETAQRISKSYVSAWRIRVWLGVQPNRQEARMTGEQRRKLAAMAAAKIKMARTLLDIARAAEIESLLVWLGLETGRRWETTGKRTGRRDTKQSLLEVRP